MTTIHDWETYPDICTIVFRELTKERKLKIFEMSSRKNQHPELIAYLKTPGLMMVGYNSIEYDYPITHFCLKNPNATYKEIYAESQRVINAEFSSIPEWNIMIP